MDIVILDFSKRSDMVPQERLLKDRHQRVMVDGEHPGKVHVTSVVPKGTVIGPLFFLLYINDRIKALVDQVDLQQGRK